MKYVDCYPCQWTMSNHKPTSITGGRSVPLLLGLAAYCTLTDPFSGLTAGGG